jgi:hypothetical protein
MQEAGRLHVSARADSFGRPGGVCNRIMCLPTLQSARDRRVVTMDGEQSHPLQGGLANESPIPIRPLGVRQTTRVEPRDVTSQSDPLRLRLPTHYATNRDVLDAG